MNSPFGNKELNYSADRKVQINSVLRSDFKRQKISKTESREPKESIFEELIEKNFDIARENLKYGQCYCQHAKHKQ